MHGGEFGTEGAELVLIVLDVVGERGILAALFIERLVRVDEDELGRDVRVVLAAAFGVRFRVLADDLERPLEEPDGVVKSFFLH